jgi:SSS family transporter
MVLAAFTWIDGLIILTYLALMLGIGWVVSWRARRRGHEGDEAYFLAGRSMPTWAVTLSILATTLSAATYIGVPQIGYSGDLSYLILNIGGVLAVLIVATLFLPSLYAAGTLTIYGLLGQRFGPGAQTAAGVAFLFGRLLASGARLFIAGIAFSLILFGDTAIHQVVAAIALFGIVGTLYTCMGGIRAVIWTDTLQIIIVIGIAMVSIAVLLNRIPLPLSELIEVLQTSGDVGGSKLRVVQSGWSDQGIQWAASFTVIAAFASTAGNVAAFGTDQDITQRMMTTRSAWRSSLSVIFAQLIGMPVVLMFLIIGVLLSVFYTMPDVMAAAGKAVPEPIVDDRKVYPHFLLTELPTGLSGLAMAGLFAAAMSSLDSAINAMASSARADLLPRRSASTGPPKAGRRLVIMMGGLLTLAAIGAAFLQQAGSQTLIDFALGVMAFAHAGLLGVFCTALFTRRGNTTSVIVAMLAGAAVVALIQPWSLGPLTEKCLGEPWALAWPYWMPVAGGVAFLVCVSGRTVEPKMNQ